MKITTIIATASLATSTLATPKDLPSQTNKEIVVISDAAKIVTPSHLWLGMGFNWSAYEGFCNPNHYFGDEAVELTEEQWSTVFRRVDFMRLKFIRLMSYSSGYLRGRDAQGEPIYVFREKQPNLYLRNVYRILDWAQAHDVHVFMGDWQMGTLNTGVQKGHPFAVRVEADFIEHLVREKGYSCIKNWCSGNEEGVSKNPAILEGWLALKKELVKRKLDVGLGGPDHYVAGEQVKDLEFILDHHPDLLSIYENHYYGKVPDTTERELIDRKAPDGINKPWFAGEAAHPRAWDNTHEEAVTTIASYIQHLHARSSGVLHWLLDSSEYREHRPHGIWKITTGEVYPRFYPLALFTRLFWAPGRDGKNGGAIIHCEPNNGPVFATAITRPNGNRCDLSYVLVNPDPKEERRVILKEQQAISKATLTVYRFEKQGAALDADGLPVPAQHIKDADLAAGVPIHLPPSSVVFVTTDDGGTPVAINLVKTQLKPIYE